MLTEVFRAEGPPAHLLRVSRISRERGEVLLAAASNQSLLTSSPPLGSRCVILRGTRGNETRTFDYLPQVEDKRGCNGRQLAICSNNLENRAEQCPNGFRKLEVLRMSQEAKDFRERPRPQGLATSG